MKDKTIVLVDDDRDFLEINRKLLENQGFRVRCYSEPGDALAAIEKEPPSLVVTDLMMEALESGFSLARRLKQDPRLAAVPVIIVTAVASRRGYDFSPQGPEDLAAMNADGYFDKPVSPQELLAKVEELIS
jgi:CheY-like chemotaxis protein